MESVNGQLSNFIKKIDEDYEKLSAVKVKVEEIDEYEEEFEEEEHEIDEEINDDGSDGAVESEQSPGERINSVDSTGQAKRQHYSASSSPGKIFVGGIARDTTEEIFVNHFAKYGEITDSVVMKDKYTRVPRGFGFVTFADPSVIDKVLADEHSIDGRMVEVKRTIPKGGPKIKKIFVGGIPSSLTEDEFKEHFSSYGVVVEHQIMVDHSTGHSRGFGFITFESEESVEKIISEGRMHDLAGKQVEIKKAEPKKDEAGFDGRGGGSRGNIGGPRTIGNYHRGGESAAGSGFYRGSVYDRAAGYNAYSGRAAGYNGYNDGPAGYGASFFPGYGGPMYSSGGAYGGGGGDFYGFGGGYGSAGGYGAFQGGFGGGRGYGNRYHPYGR